MKIHNIILYPVVYCLLCLAAGCGKKLMLPNSENQKIVLLGELVAGDSIYFRGGASSVVQSGATINETIVQNLNISLTDGLGNEIFLTGKEDDLSFTEHTVSFSSGHVSQASHKYELTAQHPEMGIAKASITIPNAFDALITDTMSTEFNGEACIQMNIAIKDNAEKNFYVVEVLQQPFSVEPTFFFKGQWLKMSDNFETYDSLANAGITVPEKMDSFYVKTYNRITYYTTDAQSEHLLNGNKMTVCRRVLLYDKTFSGGTHTTSVFLPKSQMGLQFPGSGFRTLIQVKSVAEDYFLYLKGYEQYDPFSGFDNTNAPVRLTGNINNGVGMIGGVFKREFSYYF